MTGEESPGFTGQECQLTAGGGNSRDSATESKPLQRWQFICHFCMSWFPSGTMT